MYGSIAIQIIWIIGCQFTMPWDCPVVLKSRRLQLQSKTSRVSIFCFAQFVLLCIAIGTYLMQLSTSSTEVVPA
ncbi:hypothetical protein PVAP13_7KG303506 [Panicum virgatum]|uniref:Uncharacterized protein n=1 Tax=Panicum virgatum TaxID=38727 RepID=A0A8T0QP78_PANVG|nr:hypothetical protein PVAP13_7KG303506 [Panicum virgatum]